MNAIASIAKNTAPDQDAAVRTALKTSLYPGATDESIDMVLAYCLAGNLDPLTKPVHIVPMWMPEKKDGTRLVRAAGMRDVIMPGIELYRVKAHRTGEYAGQDDAVYGPIIEAKLGGVDVRYPDFCRVSVYRLVNGNPVKYSATAYWLESYATAKRDTDAPNAMWKKRPFGQLEKCAEALALRKAFPEAVGAQPTAEEMDGKFIDVIDVKPTPAIEMPKARQIENVPAEPEAQEPGLFVTPSQRKLLLAKAENAGIVGDEELLAKFPRIDGTNINAVLAELASIAQKQDEA